MTRRLRPYLFVLVSVSTSACDRERASSSSAAPHASSQVASSGNEPERDPRPIDDSPSIPEDSRRNESTPASRLSAFAEAMLRAHNDVRANVEPTPSTPIAPLAWSSELASIAQSWADRCPSGHRPDGDLGENLFWAGGSAVPPETSVRSWADEAQHYDYATTVCSRGGRANWAFCGHYTQLVWRDTARVGCGIRTDCPGEFDTVVVCNYDPPGNVNASTRTIPRPY